MKTPDFKIGDEFMELKTPISAKVDKIFDRIEEASRQAPIIVIDSRKTKIIDKRMSELATEAMRKYKTIEKIILITKNKNVVEFVKNP
jgi:hypothetical protein